MKRKMSGPRDRPPTISQVALLGQVSTARGSAAARHAVTTTTASAAESSFATTSAPTSGYPRNVRPHHAYNDIPCDYSGFLVILPYRRIVWPYRIAVSYRRIVRQRLQALPCGSNRQARATRFCVVTGGCDCLASNCRRITDRIWCLCIACKPGGHTIK
jgi:hypothetical protein